MHGYPIRTPDADGGICDFQHEPSAVFNGAAIFVGAVVTAVLEELVEEVAVSAVDLHAVEAGGTGVLRPYAVGLDNTGNLARLKGARDNEGPFRTEQADILTGRDGTGRDRQRAVQIAGIGDAAHMPKLEEHLPARDMHGVG